MWRWAAANLSLECGNAGEADVGEPGQVYLSKLAVAPIPGAQQRGTWGTRHPARHLGRPRKFFAG